MELNVYELKNIKKLGIGGGTFNSGGNIYKYSDDVLYKIIHTYFFVEELERNIDFLMKNDVPNTAKIYDKIYFNGNFFGYSMQYLKNTITFRNAAYLKIDFDKSVEAVCNIFQPIKYLHNNNILVGDLHLDNLLIDNNGNGYLIDLDFMVFPGDEYKFNNLYNIRFKHDENMVRVSNRNTDNVRAMICALSIIFGVDLENRFRNCFEMDLENVYDSFVKSLHIDSLSDYFLRVISREDVEYFDDFLMGNCYNFKNSGLVYRKRK